MNRLLAFLLGLIGCAPQFVDTTTPGGVPNLSEYAPKMWRMGQPPNPAAWRELGARIAPTGGPVVVVKLDDEVEGDDSPAEGFGWTVVRVPMPPEDDKIWSVLVKPDPKVVHLAVRTILNAHAEGMIVVHHCVHGRDRTSLIAALVSRKLFGWTKDQAWQDMIAHGFRWELPDLDAYWLEDVP